MWKNFSNSIQNKNQVFSPKSIKELKQIISDVSKQQNKSIRCFSAGHSYAASITSESEKDRENVVLVDLKQLNAIVLCATSENKDNRTVIVEPAATFEQIETFLEKHNLTLPNFTGCLDLSIGGCLSASSHGTGYHASVVEYVESVTLLRADGHEMIVKKKDSLFPMICGGLGVLGIVIRIELKVEAITVYTESHTEYEFESKEFQELITETSNNVRDSVAQQSNFDHCFWVPIANKFYYFKRRRCAMKSTNSKDDDDVKVVKGNNSESWLGKLSDSLSPISAKFLNSIRSKDWMSARTAFKTLATFYAIELKQLPTQNSMFQLEKPVSDLASRVQNVFEMGEDSEVFIPANKILNALKMYNFLFRVLLNDPLNEKHMTSLQIQEDLSLRSVLVNNMLWQETLDAIHSKALFTSPVEVRFVPSTRLSILAANYGEDMWSVSMPWFGTREDSVHYKKAMNLFLKVCLRVYNGRFHFGKYNPIGAQNQDEKKQSDDSESSDNFLQEIRMHYGSEIAAYNKLFRRDWQAERKLFRNDFINAFFAG
jgi:hypothetical protein